MPFAQLSLSVHFHSSSSSRQVQLQLLTAIVKLFLKRPADTQQLVQSVLSLATQESDNPDLRDRGYIYWRLLSTDPAAAKVRGRKWWSMNQLWFCSSGRHCRHFTIELRERWIESCGVCTHVDINLCCLIPKILCPMSLSNTHILTHLLLTPPPALTPGTPPLPHLTGCCSRREAHHLGGDGPPGAGSVGRAGLSDLHAGLRLPQATLCLCGGEGSSTSHHPPASCTAVSVT